ncbi:hypothetical protein FPZ24_02915 [Sphingomonas panacisoli]|uniref:Uncharacterized protein n=1 Tax=Sphingomonas panacisoli TaxID=1813879 RepID=A0A5B8LER2_9SPHN|nr:hypothetical protein [Sphingomonas panacisoli]QDZ06551.1 hypothetical protein FPZ24_02915 [Sphingomonas panacisoli]
MDRRKGRLRIQIGQRHVVRRPIFRDRRVEICRHVARGDDFGFDRRFHDRVGLYVEERRAEVAVGEDRAARRGVGMGIGTAQHGDAVLGTATANQHRARADHQEHAEPRHATGGECREERDGQPGREAQRRRGGSQNRRDAAIDRHVLDHRDRHDEESDRDERGDREARDRRDRQRDPRAIVEEGAEGIHTLATDCGKHFWSDSRAATSLW